LKPCNLYAKWYDSLGDNNSPFAYCLVDITLNILLCNLISFQLFGEDDPLVDDSPLGSSPSGLRNLVRNTVNCFGPILCCRESWHVEITHNNLLALQL